MVSEGDMRVELSFVCFVLFFFYPMLRVLFWGFSVVKPRDQVYKKQGSEVKKEENSFIYRYMESCS